MARQKIRELRRGELIEAVIAAIHEYGFAALTVNEIARYAQTSTGSIHYYFGSKEALLEATMRHLMSILRQAVVARLHGKSSPENRLIAVVTGNFDESLFTRQNCSVWNQFWASAPYTPSLARLQRLNRARVTSNIRAEMRNLLPAALVDGACASVQSYMDGIWINAAQTGVTIDATQAQDDAVAFLRLVLGDRLSTPKQG
ncbi:MAG: transcriptional regulator BetI [Albidovulum sp.]